MSLTIQQAQTIRGGIKLQGNNDLYRGIALWLDASDTRSYSGSGGTWYDLSPNHYDAALQGATFAVNSFNFDYTQSQYASIPAANMFTGNNMTAIGWVYVRSYQTWSRLFDFGNGAGGVNVIVAITQGGSGVPVYSTDGADNIYSATTLPLNQWVQLVATQSGTTGKIYINGQQVASATNNGIASAVRYYNYIGRSNWGGDAYLDGKIASLRIWNRTLSVDEILTDYDTSRPVTTLTLTINGYGYPRTNGYASYLASGHPEVADIPSGARITSSISGFGTRTVINVGEATGYYFVHYDGTGLSGYADTSDTYTFTW
jgi:hypothetical protein